MSHTKPPYIAPVEIPATPAPTPRADAFDHCTIYESGLCDDERLTQYGLFARQLERELSAAKAEAERLREALKHELTALNIVLTRQRDGEVCRVSVSDLLQGIRLLEQALAAKRQESSNG